MMLKLDRLIKRLFDIYKVHIKEPFIAIRDVFLHLWVPVLFALLSYILFARVPQTVDIYRSLLKDQQISGVRIFLGTILVFILSFFVWYSGRLLSYKYRYNELTAPQQLTEFQIWAQGHNNSAVKSLPRHIRSLVQCDSKKNSRLLEHLALLYLPRFCGLLPFTGLVVGLKTATDADNSRLWLGICMVSWVGLVVLFFFRRIIPGTAKNIAFTGLDDSLFSANAENLLANIGLFCFAALTLPIVATLSGKNSFGVIAFFICCVSLNVLLLWWNPIHGKIWHWHNLLNPIFLGSLVVISGLFFLSVPPLHWSHLLGPISIAAISLFIVIVLLSTIYNWGYDYGVPAISLVLVLAIVSSAFGWNNNHQIRYLPEETISELPSSENLTTSFKTWFKNRPDLADYNDKYPVYIISAQGGGIYAAFHAAATLAMLHDTIPQFSNHVFAISGVSGGSVGASVYASLVKEFGQPQHSSNGQSPCPSISNCAQQVLNEDFLSPLFSLGLFPDLLQRFIPISINDWDRSRGLEVALEESWNNKIQGDNQEIQNPLAQPFYNFWQADGHAPALILNTTNVERGDRLLISPFKIPRSNTLLDYTTDKHAFPLSTAASLSARFPVISAAGWFTHTVGEKHYKTRLVDGGYFDNSGLATAQNIIAALKQQQDNDQISVMEELSSENTSTPKPEIINLAIVGQTPQNEQAHQSFQGLNEILSPLLGFWNVYQNRSNNVIEQARYELNRDAISQKSEKPSDYHFRAFYLNTYGLPLGWLLSEGSQDTIEAQIPAYNASWCQNKGDADITEIITSPITNTTELLENNTCVAQSIYNELQALR